MVTTGTETTDRAKAKRTKDTTDRAKAKKRKEIPDYAKAKKMKETSDRAKAWLCVRFNDNNGLAIKFNKSGFPDESRKELYYLWVKYVEQLARGLSPTSVAKMEEFQMFQRVSEGLKRKTLPDDYRSFPRERKLETVKKLVDELYGEFYDELAAATSHGPVQGDDTREDYPDDMQVGEGSGPDPASEGVANTSLPADDSSLQNVPLGSVRSVRFPPGCTVDLGSCTLSQLDNPEGLPPPSSRQCPDELNQSMSDMECRASRYPDMSPEIERLKQQFILCADKLKDREMNELLSLESRSNLEEIPSRLPEGILAEDPQNQLRKASMEDAGFQNVGSISESLEEIPRLTGRLKKNVEDIRPAVYGGSADGNLPSKSIMESVPIDRFVSAEPSADGREQWAECLIDMPDDEGVDTRADHPDDMQVGEGSARQFDTTAREGVDMQVNNPGPFQVDDVPAAAPIPYLCNTLSNDASLQNVALNQCDKPQGRLPLPVEELVFFCNEIYRRASRFPGRLPKYEFKEEDFRSFLNRLEDLEGALEDDSNTSLRSRQEEILAPLPDFSYEGLQNVTSMPESWADEEFWSNLLASRDPCTSPNLCTG